MLLGLLSAVSILKSLQVYLGYSDSDQDLKHVQACCLSPGVLISNISIVVPCCANLPSRLTSDRKDWTRQPASLCLFGGKESSSPLMSIVSSLNWDCGSAWSCTSMGNKPYDISGCPNLNQTRWSLCCTTGGLEDVAHFLLLLWFFACVRMLSHN